MPTRPYARPTLVLENLLTGTFATSTQNTPTQYSAPEYKGAIITLTATAAVGNNTLQLQFSPDEGTTWVSIGPTTTALTSAGNASLLVYPTNWSQAAGATPANLTTGGTVASIFLNAPMPAVWRVQLSVATSITGVIRVQYLV